MRWKNILQWMDEHYYFLCLECIYSLYFIFSSLLPLPLFWLFELRLIGQQLGHNQILIKQSLFSNFPSFDNKFQLSLAII